MLGGTRSFDRGRSYGFSLIELLVATAVLGLLCVFLFAIIDSSTRLWRAQEGQEDIFRQTRAALNIFSRDLNNAILTTNAAWFFVGTNRMAFLSSLPEGAQRPNDRSDICVVGYSLEWGKTDPGNPQESERLAFYRYVRFSNPTFDRNLADTNAVPEIFDQVDGTTTVREAVARNILSIHVIPYSMNAAGDPVLFDPAVQSGTPDMVDFFLTAIGENVASRLTGREGWANTNAPLIQENQQTFSLRIHLRKPPALP